MADSLNLTTIIAATIVSLPPTITASVSLVVALRTSDKVEVVVGKVEEVKKATDGLTSKLVATTKSDALQKGHAQGVAAQKSVEKKAKADNAALPFWKRQ